jgi:predicted Zn-dependent peptidase
MKIKINFLLVAFISLYSFSLKGQFKEIISKDANGYEYVSYQDDPTSLRIYTLDNGLKVYLSKNTDKPEIVTSIAVKAGSNNDPRNSTGLAHYFEHMMFKGTSSLGTSDWKKEKKLLRKIEKLFEKRRKETDPAKRDEIYKEIDQLSYEASKYAIAGEYDKAVTMLGAKGTNAYTSYDETVYLNNIPSNELERWLTLEADRFSDIVLRVFHTELETVYEEYNRGVDNNGRALFMNIISESLEGSNYSTSVIGKPEHLKNPSMTDIYQFAKDYYVPNNMAIILNGDLDYDYTIKLIDEKFGPLKANKNLAKLKANSLVQIKSAKDVGGKVVEMTDPEIEKVVVSYRFDPNSSQDDLITLTNYILSSRIGLFTNNILQKQKLLAVQAFPAEFKYYSLYNILAVPKPGQTLQEAKDIVNQELAKLKNGEFDYEDLIATLNNLKIDEETSYDNNGSNNKQMISYFINEKKWNERLSYVDNLYKYSKEDIVAFANDFFQDSKSVTTFKHKGEKSIEKVTKPQITPVVINRDSKSKMLLKLESMPVTREIDFVLPDASLIKEEQIGKVKFAHVRNTKNRLFTLQLRFKTGDLFNKDYSFASSYLPYLGTSSKSVSEIEKDFYKLAVNKSISFGGEYSYIVFSGLSENMEEAMILFDDYIKNLVADKGMYSNLAEDIIKSRKNQKVSPEAIMSKLTQYSIYGEDSYARKTKSDEEIRSLDANYLVDLIKGVTDFEFEVYYYGRDDEKAKELVSKYFNINGDFASAGQMNEDIEKEAKGVIYFVNKPDMLQVQYSEVGRLYSNKEFEKGFNNNFYNSYFGSGLSSIVFQEIRESRSLAYASYAVAFSGLDKKHYATFRSFVGTQPDKLETAVNVMNNLFSDMPKYEKAFSNVKENLIKQMKGNRTSEANIYSNYSNLKENGLDFSIYKKRFDFYQNITLDALSEYYNKDIRPYTRDILLLGNKDEINLEKLSKDSGKEIIELDVDYLFNF